jgi:selenobiotic family peptide radical SAM maturase
MIRDRWFFGRKTKSFTLQWHLTNVCPNHCRHCYDRSERTELDLERAQAVLADFRSFCRTKRVAPQLSLTGGDPFYYSRFWELLDGVAQAKIPYSILGNPIPDEAIRRLLAVRPPVYYQVSLEGLREHNDDMRGPGNFDRTMQFLADARKSGLTTHVMLTLTRANLEQVLPLGESLRGLTERFTFNRLSAVGEAVDLEMPEKNEYRDFLERYLASAQTNPVLGCKDNLFNILRLRYNRRLFPGCTGHGCGAAFNFVALLPDGEIHACRKYPSQLGNIADSTLQEIFDSPLAKRYRFGTTACQPCRLKKSCNGCPAVTYGQNQNPLQSRDPYCFWEPLQRIETPLR